MRTASSLAGPDEPNPDRIRQMRDFRALQFELIELAAMGSKVFDLRPVAGRRADRGARRGRLPRSAA